MKHYWSAAAAIFVLACVPAMAQSQSQETNPQSGASTTVKDPAGVSKAPALQSNTQGVTGAQTGCKSASAEMTNGAVESCTK